jgi:hypothetical protein
MIKHSDIVIGEDCWKINSFCRSCWGSHFCLWIDRIWNYIVRWIPNWLSGWPLNQFFLVEEKTDNRVKKTVLALVKTNKKRVF